MTCVFIQRNWWKLNYFYKELTYTRIIPARERRLNRYLYLTLLITAVRRSSAGVGLVWVAVLLWCGYGKEGDRARSQID